MTGSPMKIPFAGLDHTSAIESSTAMRVPAIPSVAEGTVRNWSPLATGTVRMGISWASSRDAVINRHPRNAMRPEMTDNRRDIPGISWFRNTLLHRSCETSSDHSCETFSRRSAAVDRVAGLPRCTSGERPGERVCDGGALDGRESSSPGAGGGRRDAGTGPRSVMMGHRKRPAGRQKVMATPITGRKGRSASG